MCARGPSPLHCLQIGVAVVLAAVAVAVVVVVVAVAVAVAVAVDSGGTLLYNSRIDSNRSLSQLSNNS